ncbi:hypothetical protein BCV69DRAFT_296809 [Microstroma glucosiphilum]|uniref:G-patch domain-containing protein n=1 Tax=Pseudomicrostroma glucosiphilum TaxID=1684307 RepID=A0A316UC75_9BASI|nr:hypothetical protein BCV69DRAFT_296809 [Pseudomicrostroma glucosiphilum]PWN22837.1 hypothetical protein BCV69DRAFT_296809 [Pseudomicrostroma glucosiphilum]
MSTPAIHIRARTPPLQESPHQDSHRGRRHGLGSRRSDRSDEDERSAWDASTGSVEARNRQRLGKTSFVREGEKSRPWTGNWVEPSEGDVSKIENSYEHDTSIEGLDQEAPQTLQPQLTPANDTEATSTMASFYAQLAASLKAPSVVSKPTAQASANTSTMSSSTAIRPRSVVPKSRSGARTASQKGTTDWFSARPRLPTASVRLDRGQDSSASEADDDRSHQQNSTSTSPTLTPCPTCSTPLPYPCPPSVLRSHLSSIAHRLALPHFPPASSSSTPLSTGLNEQIRKVQLHLDEANRGYRLLSGMGWREGMGVGRSEWEWEEGQRERERERSREKQETAKKRREDGDRTAIETEIATADERKPSPGKVLVISSDEGEEEDEDDFEAVASLDNVAGDGIDDVFHLPPQEQSIASESAEREGEHCGDQVLPTAQRPEPRLVPISISQKHDRAGLGRKLSSRSSTPSGDIAMTSGGKKRKGGAIGPEALFTLKKRERESRDRQDREERMAIRDSLR